MNPEKQMWQDKFANAKNEEERNQAIEEYEKISHDQVINSSSAEELSTLYHEAMVHSPSRALALAKLAKEKGWDIQK